MRINEVKFAAALASTRINSRELSELTGLSRSTISAVKNGKNCSPDTAHKLCEVLGSEILQEPTLAERKKDYELESSRVR